MEQTLKGETAQIQEQTTTHPYASILHTPLNNYQSVIMPLVILRSGNENDLRALDSSRPENRMHYMFLNS